MAFAQFIYWFPSQVECNAKIWVFIFLAWSICCTNSPVYGDLRRLNDHMTWYLFWYVTFLSYISKSHIIPTYKIGKKHCHSHQTQSTKCMGYTFQITPDNRETQSKGTLRCLGFISSHSHTYSKDVQKKGSIPIRWYGEIKQGLEKYFCLNGKIDLLYCIDAKLGDI